MLWLALLAFFQADAELPVGVPTGAMGDVCFTGSGLAVITALLTAVTGALGVLYRRTERNAEEWKQLALQNLDLAKDATSVAKTSGADARARERR